MLKNLSLLLVLALASCVETIPLKVLRPGDITLPESVNKIAILKRTKLTTRSAKIKNVLEGIVTGEDIHGDRNGEDVCIEGLKNTMEYTPRFEVVLPPEDNMESTGRGRFPAPLDTKRVQELCDKYHVDALVVLEAFDSDQYRDVLKQETVTKDREGRDVKSISYLAKAELKLITGWRVYYPLQSKPIDQFRPKSKMGFRGEGITEFSAKGSVPDSWELMKQVGYAAGSAYAFRISPQLVTVPREYYCNGSPAMEKAAGFVRTQHWEQAIEIWKQQIDSTKGKIAGRAAFNMALACEFDNRLDLAMVWAQKSRKEFGNPRAKEYIRVLQSRIAEDQKLKEQMKNKH